MWPLSEKLTGMQAGFLLIKRKMGVYLEYSISTWTLVITCSVGVVVALQPRLHTNQVMFIYKEDDVFGPVNLPWWETQQSLKHEMSPELNWKMGARIWICTHPWNTGPSQEAVRLPGCSDHLGCKERSAPRPPFVELLGL